MQMLLASPAHASLLYCGGEGASNAHFSHADMRTRRRKREEREERTRKGQVFGRRKRRRSLKQDLNNAEAKRGFFPKFWCGARLGLCHPFPKIHELAFLNSFAQKNIIFHAPISHTK